MCLLHLNFLDNGQSLERWEFWFLFYSKLSSSVTHSLKGLLPYKTVWWPWTSHLFSLALSSPGFPPTHLCHEEVRFNFFFPQSLMLFVFLNQSFLNSSILWFYKLMKLIDELIQEKVEDKMIERRKEEWSARKQTGGKNN